MLKFARGSLFVALVFSTTAFGASLAGIMLRGASSQCWINFKNLYRGVMRSHDDPDTNELNLLLSQFRHRSNLVMIVGNHVVEGFINRRFIKENQIRVGGEPTPSNNMEFTIVKRDRTSGIREIAGALNDSSEGRSWVYIPSKGLWVDTTIAVESKGLYADPVLIAALQNEYGHVEVFHSHPPAITALVKSERGFKMPYLVSGALPTVGSSAISQVQLGLVIEASQRFMESSTHLE